MPRSDFTRPSPVWFFREYEPVGVDLGSPAAVAAYDRNQGTDPDADDALLDRLGVGEGTRLVDLACGTGSLVVQAARRGAEAHGVDVSEEMLAFAQARAERAGASAHWHQAGFLDYVHHAEPADVVTTKSALHQLPDFWKQHSLLNCARAAPSTCGTSCSVSHQGTPRSICSGGSTPLAALRAGVSLGRTSRHMSEKSSPLTTGSLRACWNGRALRSSRERSTHRHTASSAAVVDSCRASGASEHLGWPALPASHGGLVECEMVAAGGMAHRGGVSNHKAVWEWRAPCPRVPEQIAVVWRVTS
ncbi:class I SAM-dependent methyltransferase [Streptomyces sp. AS58]|uniref:class I SAM-dependent methyltransferase n=1 Tax=Streptomyces sp. AS58 TaxID=1519489 RepID=UPI003B6392B0